MSEIEEVLTRAYDALTDAVDIWDEAGDYALMHRADDLRSAVNDLIREAP